MTSSLSSPCAPTTTTAVITWWVRPARRASIARASAASTGLPNTSPSSTTSVSEPSTRACGSSASTRASPARALSAATRQP
ncbi:hypothetical protein G6F63_013639 [Rhizopus arrhizus]|nr:hypothetical protein G6F63_013639 [Rhizopus arrhizus]